MALCFNAPFLIIFILSFWGFAFFPGNSDRTDRYSMDNKLSPTPIKSAGEMNKTGCFATQPIKFDLNH